jgi:hypothetical protein
MSKVYQPTLQKKHTYELPKLKETALNGEKTMAAFLRKKV